MQSPAHFRNILKFFMFLPKLSDILSFFNISLPFFKKITPMPLLSRVGPGYCFVFLLYLFNSLVLVRLALLVISYAYGPRLTFCKNNSKFLHEFRVHLWIIIFKISSYILKMLMRIVA